MTTRKPKPATTGAIRPSRNPPAPTRSKPAASTVDTPAPVSGNPLPPGEHRVPVADRVPVNVPMVYADQVIDVVYGVHTSKVVFGIENGTGALRAVGVAVIPTASLLIVAANIVRDLTAPSIVEETAHRLGGVLNMMREMAPPPAATLPTKSTAKDK